MSAREELRRAMYLMIAVDAAVVFVAVLLSRLFGVQWLSFCLPGILVLNFLFLKRKLPLSKELAPMQGAVPTRRFSFYACSAIFFVGTVYGLWMTAQGLLPLTTLPLLLIPLTLAVYWLRIGLKARSRNSGSGGGLGSG